MKKQQQAPAQRSAAGCWSLQQALGCRHSGSGSGDTSGTSGTSSSSAHTVPALPQLSCTAEHGAPQPACCCAHRGVDLHWLARHHLAPLHRVHAHGRGVGDARHDGRPQVGRHILQAHGVELFETAAAWGEAGAVAASERRGSGGRRRPATPRVAAGPVESGPRCWEADRTYGLISRTTRVLEAGGRPWEAGKRGCRTPYSTGRGHCARQVRAEGVIVIIGRCERGAGDEHAASSDHR